MAKTYVENFVLENWTAIFILYELAGKTIVLQSSLREGKKGRGGLLESTNKQQHHNGGEGGSKRSDAQSVPSRGGRGNRLVVSWKASFREEGKGKTWRAHPLGKG